MSDYFMYTAAVTHASRGALWLDVSGAASSQSPLGYRCLDLSNVAGRRQPRSRCFL